MRFTAFFNPFNLAIKTGRTDEGHKITFVYPKKSHQVSVNVKTETINEHKIDFASLISSFTRFLPKPGQGGPLSFLPNLFGGRTTTTTTEASDLSFDDDDSSDGSSWSTANGSSSDSSSTDDDKTSSDDTKEVSNDELSDTSSDTDSNSDTNNDTSTKKCNCKDDEPEDTSFTMEAAKISYIPPKKVNDYFAPAKRASVASPVKQRRN